MDNTKRRIAGFIAMSMLAFGVVSFGGLAGATDQATQLEDPAPEEPSLTEETLEDGQALAPEEETDEPETSGENEEPSVRSSSASRSAFSPARPSKLKTSGSPPLRAPWRAPALPRALNGGTIKVDQQDIDDGKGNEPQKEDCEFQIDYYNFPVPGSATATFTLVSPTAGGVVGTVFTTFTAANAAGLVGSGVGNISAGIAASGIPPHTNGKGHHISVDIVTSDGTTKSKTVWVRGCVATLIIDKDVTGTGSSGSIPFAFTDDVPHDSVGTLTGNQTPKSMQVVAKQAWHITENTPLPAGYTLTSDNCTNGDQASAVTLQPDTSVTCTFVNTFTPPTGTLIVDKVVTPGGASTTEPFAFSDTSGDFNVPATIAAGTPIAQTTFVVPTGSHTVSETISGVQVAAGWTLDSISCNDINSTTGATSATFVIEANETVTCTFTNKFTAPQNPQGTIQIAKALAAGSDTPPGAQTFNFTGAISTSLQLANSSGIQVVAPGGHTVTEGALPANWTLDSITCTSSNAVDVTANTIDVINQQVTMNVSDGEAVLCTFHNRFTAPRGTLEIEKVLDPTSDPGAPNDPFGFTGALPATLQIGGTTGTQSVLAGTGLSITESTIPANWTLTGINCTTPTAVPNLNTATVTFDLDGGGNVKCTFTNKWTAPQQPPPPPPPSDPAGTIIVDKVTDPSGDPTVFDFNLSGGAVNVNFGLADSSTPFDSGLIAPGIYNVTETLPAGWNLTSGTCSDGSLPGAVSLQDGETVTCTFTNTKLATITVEKQTDPDGSPQTFDFTGDITATLGDGGQASASVLPGSYSVVETAEPGWELLDVDCSSDPTGNSSGDAGSATASFEVTAGEVVTCVFTNQLIPIVQPTRIEDPGEPGDEPPVVKGRGPAVLPFTGAAYVTLASVVGLLLIGIGAPLARWRRRSRTTG